MKAPERAGGVGRCRADLAGRGERLRAPVDVDRRAGAAAVKQQAVVPVVKTLRASDADG
jgi:hypothetical protein